MVSDFNLAASCTRSVKTDCAISSDSCGERTWRSAVEYTKFRWRRTISPKASCEFLRLNSSSKSKSLVMLLEVYRRPCAKSDKKRVRDAPGAPASCRQAPCREFAGRDAGAPKSNRLPLYFGPFVNHFGRS